MNYKDFYPHPDSFMEYLKILSKLKFPNANVSIVYQYFTNIETRDKTSILDLTNFVKLKKLNKDTVKLLFYAVKEYKQKYGHEYDVDTNQ
jgi:hypothetical protein